MAEKRKHPRVRDRHALVVKILKADGAGDLVGRVFFCTTSDISAGGLRWTHDRNIPIGTHMELRIASIEPPATFRHTGQIQWTRESVPEKEFIIGVEFDTTAKQTLVAWQDFVATRLPAS